MMPSSSDNGNGRTPCVLLAVDASDPSEKAFHWYMENLHKDEYKVIVAHCIPSPRVMGEAASGAYKAMVADMKLEAEELRQNYGKEMQDRQVNADFVSSVADRPAKWLLELASEEKVSMIVMGCRNTNKAQKALLGSTTDYILHNAKCPVAICHSHRGLFGKPRGHAERRPYRDVETQTEEPPPCPCGRAFGAKE